MKDSDFQKRFERNQKNNRVHGQQLTVFYQDLRQQYRIDGMAERVLECCESKVSKGLYRQMANSLAGFDENMQLQTADNLLDCVTGIGLHTTGIKHVDRILWPLYHKIQREQANKMFN